MNTNNFFYDRLQSDTSEVELQKDTVLLKCKMAKVAISQKES
jgi:hypothetical protein